MGDLLAQAGFVVRTATRADCGRCTGRSQGTVSYNAEVAHCFRCDWSANRYTLVRDLGLAGRASACRFSPASSNRQPRQAEACPAKTRPARMRRARRTEIRDLRRRRENECEIRAFTRWRDERLRQVSGRYCALSRAALRAEQALRTGLLTPEEQSLAWDALARFYHEEARLSAAFDFLMCAKASQWLEDDTRIEDLFVAWKNPPGLQ
ncbi:MAG TPA: hypothetical protein VGT24_03490 [Candidatus Acidoferrales bacterium]|nr:hypothetical protein [Candidatus Acidoferrales bacterium]